jgi:hypothetical protein
MADFIRPADAFRIILRAIYPQNPRLPDRIKSYRFFRAGQRRYGLLPLTEQPPTPEHVRFPHQALRILRDSLQTQKTSLQGVLNGGPSAPINAADAATGDLDVFAETLAIGDGYVYRRVWCSRADVLALVAEYVLNDAPRKLGSRSGVEYVAAYIREDLNPSIERFRARAIADKIKGARKFEPEYHRQMAARGVATTRGRRRNPETTAN